MTKTVSLQELANRTSGNKQVKLESMMSSKVPRVKELITSLKRKNKKAKNKKLEALIGGSEKALEIAQESVKVYNIYRNLYLPNNYIQDTLEDLVSICDDILLEFLELGSVTNEVPDKATLTQISKNYRELKHRMSGYMKEFRKEHNTTVKEYTRVANQLKKVDTTKLFK